MKSTIKNQQSEIPSDIHRWQSTEEGQFFERKSAFDRASGRSKQRKVKELAWDVAETLSAMANADGGEMVIGLENNGAITGVPHLEDRIRWLLGIPKERNYVTPPLSYKSQEVITADGLRLLHFEVERSPEVHQLADGRYLLRVDDRNSPFAADRISSLKSAKAQGLLERSFPHGARLDDLDLTLVHTQMGSVWPELSPENILQRYGLIAQRNGKSVPTLAALLLFGLDPIRWHPRCGIDFVRWEGKEQKHGVELNIAKRIRIEAPLAVLIQKAREAIQPFIRERQRLYDLFFAETLEYPTFAWQEAIVNAVAHRDYTLQGAPIEVWMYEDRMEIRSAGLPPAPVTIDVLNRRERVHFSRNPLLVRVLADLKYMRELGEGIPRIFDEMDRAGCYPPRFEVVGGFIFQVTLRNAPVYDRVTLQWLGKFQNVELSGDQKRMMVYAHAHSDRFTSREYQKIIGTDIYEASTAIKDMISKGVVKSLGKGSRIYAVQEPLAISAEMPPEFSRLLSVLQRKRRLNNTDVRATLNVARNTASRLLAAWVQDGWLVRMGEKRGSVYKPSLRFMHQPENAPDKNKTGA